MPPEVGPEVVCNPPLSVVIPAYNGEEFIAEALESIRQQRYEPIEIIVVDDGSTDGTERAVVGRPGVRYVSQAHTGGPAAGRNRGIKESAGEIIGFLDQDDLWPADKLGLQIPRLVNDESLDVVLGRTQMLHLRNGAGGGREFEARTKPVDYMMVSSALFRRTAFDKVGLFDQTLTYFGDDLDWFIRARESGAVVCQSPEVTLFWRIHETNTSHNPLIRDHERGCDRALTEVIKRSLDRRRQ